MGRQKVALASLVKALRHQVVGKLLQMLQPLKKNPHTEAAKWTVMWFSFTAYSMHITGTEIKTF